MSFHGSWNRDSTRRPWSRGTRWIRDARDCGFGCGSDGSPSVQSRSDATFLRISIRFRWPRRRRKAKWGAPDPGPRSSDDQGIYLACLPAQNIRPSHSPSTWARPAPPRQPGQAITHRTSHGRPIQPTLPAYMTHLRSEISRARLYPAQFANGRWLIPFRDAGLRGRRDHR